LYTGGNLGEIIMGMGAFSVGGFVIEYDDLKKICPEEIHAIENEKFFNDIGWGTIGRWLSFDDDDQLKDEIYFADENITDEIVEKYVDIYSKHIIELNQSFYEKTKLTLSFDYYDKDNGDRYDNPADKDGCIFCVGGMVQLTPAGEKFKDIVTQRSWTQYG
jgi:hypothetical protein